MARHANLRCIGLSALLWAAPAPAEPLFFSSVTSNNIDYISRADPSALACLRLRGQGRREMPDKRRDALFADGVFVFEAGYLDGKRLEFWAHPDFASAPRAQRTVEPLAQAVGRLPSFMRRGLSHVVVHRGDLTAFAEDQGGFFVVYSENVAKRIRSRDLEETVFHESVHATLDIPHARSSAWRRAQRRDVGFLTGYGAENPRSEDLAESLLLTVTALAHPERLPKDVRQAIARKTPNRLAFTQTLWSKLDKPWRPVAKARVCS